jgi:hypothetical protein
MGNSLCKMHYVKCIVDLLTWCYERAIHNVIFLLFFFLNLAIIGFNYKLICWGSVRLKDMGPKYKKHKWNE